MEFFYTPPSHISADHLTIDGDELSHLTHVMRKKAGDEIMVVDGAGIAYRATITDIAKRSARCDIMQRIPRLHEPRIDLTLAVGILKNPSRFDFLIEKATELGVNRIVPLLTERTIGQKAKTDRWQKIALAAMKQSGRCILPRIERLTIFSDFVQSPRQKRKLIAHEQSENPMSPGAGESAAICVGPEGGFSSGEIRIAEEHGFQSVSLGSRRLRTETAAVVSVQMIISGDGSRD